jgi:hypothetical protein
MGPDAGSELFVLFLRLELGFPADAEEGPADEAPSPILPYQPHSPSTP